MLCVDPGRHDSKDGTRKGGENDGDLEDMLSCEPGERRTSEGRDPRQLEF